MIEIHPGSLFAGFILGYLFGGFLVLWMVRHDFEDGWNNGCSAAKEIWWEFKRKKEESEEEENQ